MTKPDLLHPLTHQPIAFGTDEHVALISWLQTIGIDPQTTATDTTIHGDCLHYTHITQPATINLKGQIKREHRRLKLTPKQLESLMETDS